ncbi:MAG: type II toxin-antitoxin system VapB family antitoxin [Candidatus Omnitrophica bacterium]|nr:type II toxin-antitoxin system VapB family antitoxin [Candidatus Omnitrophota bacterium]
MRTTIELPDDLVAEAMRVSHVKTKTTVITLGLQELINKHRIEALRSLRGKIDLSIDVRKSRGR